MAVLVRDLALQLLDSLVVNSMTRPVARQTM
jgi:hypothetical protein